jgi:hypothetical protein
MRTSGDDMGAIKKMIDFDSDSKARRNLIEILKEECRLLYPFEAAWLLAVSLSTVYEVVPRAKGLEPLVRFDPRVIKEIKDGGQADPGSSLKTEKKQKMVDLSNPKIRRKIKVDVCL